MPTAPTIYQVAQVEKKPVELNNHLGHYTNFANLLDLAAVSLPAGMRPDGVPFGVSLIAPAFTDKALLTLGPALPRLRAKIGTDPIFRYVENRVCPYFLQTLKVSSVSFANSSSGLNRRFDRPCSWW